MIDRSCSGFAFGEFISALCRSTVTWEQEGKGDIMRRRAISGGTAKRVIVVGRYWRALNPNRVCGRALPVAPSYLRRPPTLPHQLDLVVEQLHCEIPIVHVSAAYVHRRIQSFMRSLAPHFDSPSLSHMT